jgi:arylsulfatase A-like enzyme
MPILLNNKIIASLGMLGLCVSSANGKTAGIPSKDPDRPNVVVILVDDQGYGGVSCYPHHKIVETPNIDKLAQEGVKFTQGYAAFLACAPTRASILTGYHPAKLGFYSLTEPAVGGIPNEYQLVSERLKPLGYKTGIVGKWHVGDYLRNHPNNRGFDYSYVFIEGQHDYFDPIVGHSWEGGAETLAFILEDMKPVAKMKYTTYEFTDKAISFIEENANNPFYLYLAYNAIHAPLQAPDELIRRHAVDPDHLTEADTVRAMTAALDDGVGQVMNTLERLGIDDNTIVFYLSDNGGAPFSDNWIFSGSKGSFYEGGIRVPFIMRWPAKVPKGVVYHRPVVSFDIASTIMAAVNNPCPDMDGVDLTPYIRNEKEGNPHDILYFSTHKDFRSPVSSNTFAIREGKWKLVSDPFIVRNCNLYDVEADPAEQKGLKDKFPEKYNELLIKYLTWINKMPESLVKNGDLRLNGNALIFEYEKEVQKLTGKKPRLKVIDINK